MRFRAAGLLILTACSMHDSGASSDASALADTAANSGTLGEVFARITNDPTSNGQPSFVLGAQLFSPPRPDDPCTGASLAVVPCCYVPSVATADASIDA